jgi:nuclear pore complex protein Nup155
LDTSFCENVDSKIKLLDMQRRVLGVCIERSRQARATGSSNAPEEAFVYELERELKQLSDLYNDFAKPCELWDICLEMVHFSQYHDPDGEIVCDLWDKLLLQAASRAPSAATCLREACLVVRALGVKLFPSDVAFPVIHVALRLELMAAGLWGVPDVAVEAHVDDEYDTSEVADALVVACKGLAEPVQRAYDRLLATPAQRMHDKRLSKVDALQTPRLRLRLLRSVYFVLQLWDQSLVPKATAYGEPRAYATGGHVRAAIGDLCVSYASESRRMQCPNEVIRANAEELAAAFDTFGRRLLSS